MKYKKSINSQADERLKGKKRGINMNHQTSYCNYCQKEVVYQLKEECTEVHRLDDWKVVKYQRLIPTCPICQCVMTTIEDVTKENLKRLSAAIV